MGTCFFAATIFGNCQYGRKESKRIVFVAGAVSQRTLTDLMTVAGVGLVEEEGSSSSASLGSEKKISAGPGELKECVWRKLHRHSTSRGQNLTRLLQRCQQTALRRLQLRLLKANIPWSEPWHDGGVKHHELLLHLRDSKNRIRPLLLSEAIALSSGTIRYNDVALDNSHSTVHCNPPNPATVVRTPRIIQDLGGDMQLKQNVFLQNNIAARARLQMTI